MVSAAHGRRAAGERVPEVRNSLVLGDAKTVRVELRQLVGRPFVAAALPGLQIPLGGGRVVAWRSPAFLIHEGELGHRGGIALIGGLTKKPQGRAVIRLHATAVLEREAELVLSRRAARLGRPCREPAVGPWVRQYKKRQPEKHYDKSRKPSRPPPWQSPGSLSSTAKSDGRPVGHCRRPALACSAALWPSASIAQAIFL